MKIVREEILVGGKPSTWPSALQFAYSEIKAAIEKVVWPVGATSFTINPVEMGNGVKPIKNGFVAQLTSVGWQAEVRATLSNELGPGKIDAIKKLSDNRLIAVEWETGNISSSHRALNKMATGMLANRLAAGFLVLPDRALYTYLTDRIGNIQELFGYFPMYRSLKLKGVLGVIAVMHDATSSEVPLIPKGLDGLSLVRRKAAK